MIPSQPPLQPPPSPSQRAAGLGTLLAAVTLVGQPALNRTFVSADDWTRIDLAAGLLEQDPGALTAALQGASPLEALRLTALPLWVADLALFDLATHRYFLTNLLLLLAAAAAVFLIASRLSRSSLVGLAAGSLFAFTPAAAQPLTFLAARDDAVAAALCLGVAALWPRLRGSRGGLLVAGGLYALALLAKASALGLPLLLLALDRVDGEGPRWRQLRDPAGLFRGPLLLGITLAWVVGLLFVVGLGPLQQLMGPGSAPRMPFSPPPAAWALPWIVAGLAGFAARGGERSPGLRLGLLWIGAALLPVLPFLYAGGVVPGDRLRYLLLPSAGAAIAGSAALGRLRAPQRTALVGVLLVLGGGTFAGQARHQLHLGSSVPELLAALDAASASDAPPTQLTVALQQHEHDVPWLLSSNVVRRRHPTLQSPPRWFVQGQPDSFEAMARPYARGGARRIAIERDWNTLLPDEGALLLADVGFGRVHDPPSWAELPDPPPPRDPWLQLRGPSSFGAGTAGLPPLDLDPGAWAHHEEGRALEPDGRPSRLRSERAWAPGEYGSEIALNTVDAPPRLVSPPIDVPTADRCWLTLEVTAQLEGRRHRGAPRFAVGWSQDGGGFDRGLAIDAPPSGRRERVRIDLATSPAWRMVPVVHRVAVVGLDRIGTLDVHDAVFEGCDLSAP